MTHAGINGTSESNGNSEEGWGLFLVKVLSM